MTPEMRRTLTNFQTYYAAHGVGPSMRELATIEGLASPAGVLRRVHALAAAGYLVRVHGHSRAYAPAGTDLSMVSIDELRAELEKREARHG
jgi:SOS-response transcriptional repressor LexA